MKDQSYYKMHVHDQAVFFLVRSHLSQSYSTRSETNDHLLSAFFDMYESRVYSISISRNWGFWGGFFCMGAELLGTQVC